MSRLQSARRDRGGNHSARYEDPYFHNGFSAEPRRYVSDTAYDRPRRRGDRENYDGTPSRHTDRSRDDRRREVDSGLSRVRQSRTHESPSRRSHTPAKQPQAQQATEGPLRRQSTQPPRRRNSPSTATTATPSRRRSSGVDAADLDRTLEYRRRDVEPNTSPRRQRTPAEVSPALAGTKLSTALVVAGARHRESEPASTPRRTRSSRHHHRHGESADGTVDSPQRRTHGRTERSPRRSARGSTPAATPRPSSKGSPLEAAPRSRSTKRREPESGRRSHREQPGPKGTGRYVSPPEERSGASPRRVRSSSRHAKRHEADDVSPRRPTRERPTSRSSRRSAAEVPAASRTSSAREPSARPPAQGRLSAVPPLQPAQVGMTSGSSTFLRPPSHPNSARGATPLYSLQQPAATMSSSRRSSSGIEVLGISPHPFARPRPTTTPTHRLFEPTPTPPRVAEIREKIHETKEWIEDMKRKVERDMEREERHRSRQRSRHASATRHRTPSTRRRDDTEDTRLSRRDHSSSRPSHKRVAEAEDRSATRHPRPVADSRRTSTTATSDEPHLHRDTHGAAAANGSGNHVGQAHANGSTRASGSTRQPPASSNGKKPSIVVDSGSRSTAGGRQPVQNTPSASDVVCDVDPPSVVLQGPAPPSKPQEPQPIPTAINTTIDEDPVFSFPSFLDGNTFHTTAALCQYNIALAEALNDDQLDIMRAAVFDHDEVSFAELLYGDDIHAELALIEATLSNSRDGKVRAEMRRVQSEAVKRFADKCTAAREKLLKAANGSLAAAVRQASVGLERAPYGEAEAVAAPY